MLKYERVYRNSPNVKMANIRLVFHGSGNTENAKKSLSLSITVTAAHKGHTCRLQGTIQRKSVDRLRFDAKSVSRYFEPKSILTQIIRRQEDNQHVLRFYPSH